MRTFFELSYAPWSLYAIQETKRITLDLGSNFSKFEIIFSAVDSIPNYTVGISLQDNKGNCLIEEKEVWLRHWEAIDDFFVGEGIVMNPKVIDSAFARISNVPDQSNILIVTRPQDTLTYYAGFVWKKSGQVATVDDWEDLLKKQA